MVRTTLLERGTSRQESVGRDSGQLAQVMEAINPDYICTRMPPLSTIRAVVKSAMIQCRFLAAVSAVDPKCIDPYFSSFHGLDEPRQLIRRSL